jgi:hypothetical protein
LVLGHSLIILVWSLRLPPLFQVAFNLIKNYPSSTTLLLIDIRSYIQQPPHNHTVAAYFARRKGVKNPLCARCTPFAWNNPAEE